jgi:pyridoxamine 5'-phosphate oxidase
MVLLKHLALEQGYAVFYTHYGSRKAAELRHNPRAAAVLYWEELGRQMRLEGRIVQSPADESDRYFATRPWRSQLNAWVSEQSKPLADPLALEQRAARKARELGVPSDQSAGDGPRELPRPPFWGGYRLWLEALELWVEGTDRFHERLRYTRELVSVDQSSFRTGAWRHERLQP